jgi:hypothetical protein
VSISLDGELVRQAAAVTGLLKPSSEKPNDKPGEPGGLNCVGSFNTRFESWTVKTNTELEPKKREVKSELDSGKWPSKFWVLGGFETWPEVCSCSEVASSAGA